ncbi:WecB/TagA/CpsF family glycosyltransferase [Rhodoferax lithotrophicus]|nr:WecB/TagA/CpsF family glycosyltransferase [Rhodoferax sp. MIZ03]
MVLNTAIDLMDWDTAVHRLVTKGQARQSAVVCICNVHMTVTANRHPALAHVLKHADMVTPDGAPVAWVLRRAGYRDQQRINGPDLMWRYLAQAERLGQIVSFYGGTEATMDRLLAAMLHTFPMLKLGCMVIPPFRTLTVDEDLDYANRINRSGTNVLFVGLGCPKQEVWMGEHRGIVHAAMVGVGAAFDYHAGTIKRAPLWMQNSGLEWLHRLFAEPRRLWRRYLVTNTLFITGMAKTGFKASRMDD